jgi:hypothetical protein
MTCTISCINHAIYKLGTVYNELRYRAVSCGQPTALLSQLDGWSATRCRNISQPKCIASAAYVGQGRPRPERAARQLLRVGLYVLCYVLCGCYSSSYKLSHTVCQVPGALAFSSFPALAGTRHQAARARESRWVSRPTQPSYQSLGQAML